MRDIKFRFFDTKLKNIFTTYEMNSYEVWDSIEDDRFIHMQFVGQKDKNQKEIFEGDILKHIDANGEKIGVVTWMNEINSFRIVFSADSYYFIQDIDEVIGNIHENPELLEVLINKKYSAIISPW